MDLDAWLEEGRTRALLQIITGRPRTARWRIAAAADPERVQKAAEAHLSGEADEQAYRPAVDEWTPTEELLARVLHMLGVIAHGQGFKDLPEELVKFPRPENPVAALLEEFEAWQDAQLTDAVVDIFTHHPRTT